MTSYQQQIIGFHIKQNETNTEFHRSSDPQFYRIVLARKRIQLDEDVEESYGQ